MVSGNLGYMFDTADAFLLFGALPGMRWVYVGVIAVGLPETLRRGGLHLVAVLVFLIAGVLALVGKQQLVFTKPEATIAQAEASVASFKSALAAGQQEVAGLSLTGKPQHPELT